MRFTRTQGILPNLIKNWTKNIWKFQNRNPIKPESLENSEPESRNWFKKGPFYAMHIFKLITSSTQKPNPVRIFTDPNAKNSKSFKPVKLKFEDN